MAFKVTSSSGTNESFSALSSTHNAVDFLIVSIEDQVCLDSIAGWQQQNVPEVGEHSNHVAPPMLTASNTATQTRPVETVPAQISTTITGATKAVKRKICDNSLQHDAVCSNDNGARNGLSVSGKAAALSGRQRGGKAMGIDTSFERPRSLPDFRSSRFSEVLTGENVISANGKEAAEREDIRLQSLASTAGSGGKSKSLSSITDMRDHSVPPLKAAPQNFRKEPLQGYSPSPDAVPRKKSCVRRLNLDDDTVLPDNKTANHASPEIPVTSPATGAGFRGILIPSKLTLNSSARRQLLGMFSEVGRTSDVQSTMHPDGSTVAPSGSPMNSQQSCLSTQSQNVMSNLSENSLDLSEKLKAGSDFNKALFKPIETSTMRFADNSSSGASVDSVNFQFSQELFVDSQRSGIGQHTVTEGTTQGRRTQNSQRTRGLCHNFENLDAVFRVLRKEFPAPVCHISFTASQIEHMCELLSQLD